MEKLNDGWFKIQRNNGQIRDIKKSDLQLSKEPPKKYTWRTVRYHVAENPPSFYDNIGIVGFPTRLFKNLDRESKDYAHPFAKLVEELWPGDWRNKLEILNVAIKKHNIDSKPQQPVKEADEDEWWMFWGIIILAEKIGAGGVLRLYDKTPKIIQ